MMPTAIVAYLALFATVGFLFLLVSLTLGRFLRAHSPTAQKVATYECGEPAVGPGSVQFDLRFYVVALVFLIFEVEVAFFFPPAAIFGSACQLLDTARPKVGVVHAHASTDSSANGSFLEMQPAVAKTYQEFGVSESAVLLGDTSESGIAADKAAIEKNTKLIEKQGRTLALGSMIDLAVFFAVLLVGFAFVWRRGDLDWVRATRHPATPMETAALMARLRQGDA